MVYVLCSGDSGDFVSVFTRDNPVLGGLVADNGLGVYIVYQRMAHLPTMAPMIVKVVVVGVMVRGVMVGGAVSEEMSRWPEGQMTVRTRCPVCVWRQKASVIDY